MWLRGEEGTRRTPTTSELDWDRRGFFDDGMRVCGYKAKSHSSGEA